MNTRTLAGLNNLHNLLRARAERAQGLLERLTACSDAALTAQVQAVIASSFDAPCPLQSFPLQLVAAELPLLDEADMLIDAWIQAQLERDEADGGTWLPTGIADADALPAYPSQDAPPYADVDTDTFLFPLDVYTDTDLEAA